MATKPVHLIPSISVLLTACSGHNAESAPDAGVADQSVLRAGSGDAAERGCVRDTQCDGVGATCDRNGHECVMRCPTVVIDSPRALAAARRCREIEGDLLLRESAVLSITGDDLPYLERITGSLISAGGKPLHELSLPALRVIGTSETQSVLEIILDGESLNRVSFPALRSVHGGVGMFGLNALRELDLGALERVDESFALTTLPRLTTLLLDPELSVGKSFQLGYLCNLQADSFTAPSAAELKGIGCCTEQAAGCEDDLQCRCAGTPAIQR